MKDYISAYERTHFTWLQKLKYEFNKLFRGRKC